MVDASPVINTESVMALNGQGSKISHSSGSPTTWAEIEEVTSINGPDGSANLIDTSHLGSTRKEYLAGLGDNGSIQLTCNFTAGTQQMLLFDMFNNSTDPEEFKIEIPSDSTRTTFHKFAFLGIVTKWSLAEAVDDKVNLNITLQTTGGVIFTPSA